MTEMQILNFLCCVVVAGLFGAVAMETAMWLITRAGWAQGNMIIAIGSLITRTRVNAFRVGAIVHAVSAVVFSIAYALLMRALGMAALPGSIALGLGVGFVHGMLVSLMLVWVVAEQHPLDEFDEAGLAVGLSHLAGHVAFGGAVGLVVGAWPSA
jgi:uncharacterized membrane protein YagU involved in acid resistance